MLTKTSYLSAIFKHLLFPTCLLSPLPKYVTCLWCQMQKSISVGNRPKQLKLLVPTAKFNPPNKILPWLL